MSSSVTEPLTITVPDAGEYRVDPDASSVTFTTRHLFGLGGVRGGFQLHGGTIRVADPVTGSSASAVISTGSFATASRSRDSTVRSARFLDADRFPHITFDSTGLDHDADGWRLRGVLSAHGVGQPVDVTVSAVEPTGTGLRLRAEARIDRCAFGIRAMRGMAGRYLSLRFDITANRA